MRQIDQEAAVAVEVLGTMVEDEHLDGRTEVVVVRTILELVPSFSLKVRKDLDAYQERYSAS